MLLEELGIAAAALHSHKPQRARLAALDRFKSGAVSCKQLQLRGRGVFALRARFVCNVRAGLRFTPASTGTLLLPPLTVEVHGRSRLARQTSVPAALVLLIGRCLCCWRQMLPLEAWTSQQWT